MSPRRLLAVGRRVARQLRHDRRTVVLLVVVPSALLALLRYTFDEPGAFAGLAPAMLGVFPFLLMFLVTSVTVLRERTGGTLERLLTTPVGRVELLGGYALALAGVAVVQVTVALVTVRALGVHLAHPAGWLLLVALLDAVLGVALGLLASAFARSEFQAVQLMPVVVLPQFLLCGLLEPRARLATVLRWVSDVLPLSYAVDGLQRVARPGPLGGGFARDVGVVSGCVLAALALGAATLRRRSG